MWTGSTQRKPSEFACFAAAILRGEEAVWPTAWTREHERDFLDQARRNGIEALLHTKLHAGSAWRSWPGSVRETLRINSQVDAAAEIIRRIELARVLGALSEAGLEPLLFKGTPLAYSLYPAPHLRPRVDTDVLLPRSQIDPAQDVMMSLGYEPELAIPGDAILSQMILKRTDERGLSHTFDVHWKISNPQAFADILTYEELMAECKPVSRIGAGAVAPRAVHALLVACIHRAAHHLASNRLIWLYDLHLLVRSMSEDDLARFARLALETGVGAVCLDALEVSHDHLATPLSARFLGDFRSAVADGKAEATSAYATRPLNRFQLLWRDLRSKASPRAALRSLRQQAFPPPSYILRRYNTRHKALLPYLYTRRFVEGVPKLFKRFS